MLRDLERPNASGTSELSTEEVWRRGKEIYNRELKHKLEPEHLDEIVVINIVNADYFVDADEDRAIDAALERYPDEIFYIGRVGRSYVDRIGTQAEE